MTNTNPHPLANPFTSHNYRDGSVQLFRSGKHGELKLPDSVQYNGTAYDELHVPQHIPNARNLDYRGYAQTWNDKDIYTLDIKSTGSICDKPEDDAYFKFAKQESKKLIDAATAHQKIMIAQFEALHPSKWVEEKI